MKKSLILFGGALFAAVGMTGCANVQTNNGSPTVGSVGMNFYSDVSANAAIPGYPAQDYKVVKRGVTATATLQSFFTAFNFGDASYATLKAQALEQAPGATDLTDVVIDYKTTCILGVNTVTVTLTGTAIKY